MAATQFESAGPVGRYWLAHCEGFAVRGGADGVVEELIRDADPHVTTRLVVRTGHRRRKVVPAGSVAVVVPAERLVVVERARRRHPRRPPLPTPSLARLRPPVRRAQRAVLRSARGAARLARPTSAVLVRSLRMLGAELRASAALLLRSRGR
jgi:hypothetical protein